jgi:hypothetical protein
MTVLPVPSLLRALVPVRCLITSLGFGLAAPTTGVGFVQDAGSGPVSDFRALVDGACSVCHGGPVPESGLDLEGDLDALATADGERASSNWAASCSVPLRRRARAPCAD